MFHISLKNTSGWVLLMMQQSNKFCGFSDDSWSCEQLKKHVTDKYFEKKLRLWTLITFCYRKSMLQLQYLSDWYLHGVYVWQKFWRRNVSNWVIIWIRFKVIWLLWVLYSVFSSSDPSFKEKLDGCFRPRLSPDAQKRAFAKNGKQHFLDISEWFIQSNADSCYIHITGGVNIFICQSIGACKWCVYLFLRVISNQSARVGKNHVIRVKPTLNLTPSYTKHIARCFQY